jgi:hypothetical protein
VLLHAAISALSGTDPAPNNDHLTRSRRLMLPPMRELCHSAPHGEAFRATRVSWKASQSAMFPRTIVPG